ncbi:hypothetical protein EDD15DRAFT_2382239 [Pisolithus albus]|nr:hypothetical protein EDD15DRAFT_2382239 [Pisolithus albus]
MHAYRITAWELGVATVEERMADLRVRLWQKAPLMKTWISTLTKEENRLVGRQRTWSSQTAHMVKCTLKTAKKGAEHQNCWIYKALLREGKISPIRLEGEDDPEKEKARVRNLVDLEIKRRSFALARTNSNEATKTYTVCTYGQSRRYIQAAAHMPYLNEGIIWLARLRTSSWWTTQRRRDFLKNTGKNFEHLPEGACMFCGEETRSEINHMLLHCPEWNQERRKWLQPLLNVIEDPVRAGQGRTPPETVVSNFHDSEISTLLLGGSFHSWGFDDFLVTEYVPEREIRKHYTKEPAPSIRLFERGWGGRPECYLHGHSTHVFVPVAMFLAEIMPKHKEKLFYGEQASRNPLRYPRLTGQETRMNRGTMWNGQRRYDWDLEDGDELALNRARATLAPGRPEFYQANAPRPGPALSWGDASSEMTKYQRSERTQTAPTLDG